MRVLERRHGQQDADEEGDRPHVDARERMDQGEGMLRIVILMPMNQVADEPEYTEPEQDAHERREVRDGLEHRHSDQDPESQEEHHVALELGGGPVDATLDRGGDHQSAAQHVGSDRQRHQQVDERGQKQALHDLQGGDLAADPEHRGRHVPDRRPGATGVGRDHDDAGEKQPVIPLGEQLLHQRDHHDGRREVVEDR